MVSPDGETANSMHAQSQSQSSVPLRGLAAKPDSRSRDVFPLPYVRDPPIISAKLGHLSRSVRRRVVQHDKLGSKINRTIKTLNDIYSPAPSVVASAARGGDFAVPSLAQRFAQRGLATRAPEAGKMTWFLPRSLRPSLMSSEHDLPSRMSSSTTVAIKAVASV